MDAAAITTSPVPPVPYGMAKRIIATMNAGDVVIVRPQWVVSFHNAARRMGVRLAAVSFCREDGAHMYRMLRLADGWRRTEHLVCRAPRRDATSGRWLKDRAA